MCIALEERTVSKMARYAVEHIWEGKQEYFLIRDHQSWQMVLLPSKYLSFHANDFRLSASGEIPHNVHTVPGIFG